MIPSSSEARAEQKRIPTIVLFATLLTTLAIVTVSLWATNVQAAIPIGNREVLAWRLVPAVTGANLRDVHMVSATDGWAVGENGTVLRYDGTSWSPVNINPQPANETLVDVHMLSATDGYIGGWGESGASGTIYRWNGTSWGLVYNAPRDINRIDAVAPNDVWASGVGQIYHYNGTSWTLAYNVPQGPNVFAIQMVSANEGWAVGANQLIAHYLNGSWTILEPSPAPYTLYDSFFTAPNDGWAVGFTDSTYVMHYDGVAWTRAYSPTAQLSRMYFLSATDGWAVSYFDILHYDGTGFTEVPNPYPDGLNSIYMLTATDGWIVGTNGAMLHYSDDSTATPTVDATATGTVAATPTATATCTPGWRVISSPNVGTGNNLLLSVSAVSPDDAWAVGYHHNVGSSGSQALTMNWDGSQWNVVPASNPGAYATSLNSVSAVSGDDIWAVGAYLDSPSATIAHPLTIHWDGSQWNIVPISGVESSNITLFGVSALASNDIWAVGVLTTGSNQDETFTMHWDGSQWTVVPSPSPASKQNILYSVSAVSANDVWAVGYLNPADAGRALIIHWNGTAWNQVTAPNLGYTYILYSVSAAATNDVWAVGEHPGPSGPQETILHWDGTQWSEVPGPKLDSPIISLYGVDAVSASDVWAAGYYVVKPGPEYRTLTIHWDGSQWAVVPSPNVQSNRHILHSISAVSSQDVWTVGEHHVPGGPPQTLVERYVGQCITPTPMPSSTPTITATPTATPSATSTPIGVTATSTPIPPTATPSPCTIEFTDVPSTNTFYTQVRCLACRGIMGGYADNTFRPNNDITRGQLSKIVANSAGFNEPVSAQTFEDVEPDNTFYVYVERMAGRGIIGGYTCGGTGEPCGAENKPYFRPNANATRGQISKIVSEAKGYSDPQAGQTFEDVAVGSTFHLWIERLASRGIMGGYACGGAGEPCGTGNKPYFRPNAKATRGQTSKIVANTFFPECSVAPRR